MAHSKIFAKRRGGGGADQGGGRSSSSSSVSSKPVTASNPPPPSKPASPPKSAPPPSSKAPPQSAPAVPPSSKSPNSALPLGTDSKGSGKDKSGKKFPKLPKPPKAPHKPKKHDHGYFHGTDNHGTKDSTTSPSIGGDDIHCGKKCGAGIGAGFGGLILLSIFLFLFLRRRRHTKASSRNFSMIPAENKAAPQNSKESQDEDLELGVRDPSAKVPTAPEQVYIKHDEESVRATSPKS